MQEISLFSPVIGIIGPRQVGKTTHVKQFMQYSTKKCLYIDLEKPSDYQKMEEAEFYFSTHTQKCVIIDEIQIRPELFAIIRSAVDEHRVPARFIILGSASPQIIKGTSQSLAGRISYIHIQPFSLLELKDVTRQNHQFLGGFPKSILAKTHTQSLRWLDTFIQTYIERDLPILGLSSAPILTRRLWEMLSWQNGGLLNVSSIGNSLGISNVTIKKYIDFLEGAFMIKTLHPFTVNVKKRIVKTPKVFISDTGLLHRLMRFNSFDDLLGSPFLGASFEAYVLQQILAEKPRDIELFFYRTHAGAEIDLVLTKALKPIAAIEVKYSSTPKISKGFYNGIEDLKTTHNYIILPASEWYLLKNKTRVLGIQEFLQNELPYL